MIITKIIPIKINRRNIEHYLSKNYKCKLNNTIDVNVMDVTRGSGKKIKVSCEICENISELAIHNYWKNYNTGNYNFYTCHKCHNNKTKMTSMKIWGHEHPSKSDEIKEKTIKTNLEKYGVEYVFQDDKVKEKIKKTNLEKYGVEYVIQSGDIQDIIKRNNLQKWGCEYPLQNEYIKNKIKKTNIERYGVEYVLQNDSIIQKAKNTKIKKGLYSSDISDFSKYKNKVYTLTNKIKSELFKCWDGYDFYDKEYIICNFEKPYHHSDYPTVDHKISVIYGYINGISPVEISDINNLCITKRYINSSKGSKCDIEFIKKLNT